jgi:hypothetical protein
MKTRLLIADEKLTAFEAPPIDFEPRILSIVITNNIVSITGAIFSRDGPLPCCK